MQTVEGTKRPFDPRFITGLSAVYHGDRERSSLLAVDQCNDAYFSPQTLFMQGMSGKPSQDHATHNHFCICRIQNLDIPQAGRVGAPRLGGSSQRTIILHLSNPQGCPGKTRTYHGRVGSERLAERPGGVGHDWVPT